MHAYHAVNAETVAAVEAVCLLLCLTMAFKEADTCVSIAR